VPIASVMVGAEDSNLTQLTSET